MAVNDRVFFVVVGGSGLGTELWRSDGTADGTARVVDPAAVGIPTELTNVSGRLFFRGGTGGFVGTAIRKLYKTDGTATGTMLVRDINPGGTDEPSLLTNVNGRLFFVAYHPATGAEWYTSDGTTEGTVLVKDIVPGAASGAASSVAIMPIGPPVRPLAVGDTLFFAATTPAAGVELWKSDGTADGTVLVRDLNSITLSSAPGELINFGGTLFFTAFDGGNFQLWKSQMTPDGPRTVQVTNYSPGQAIVGNLVALKGALHFTARTPEIGFGLWRTDGTLEGTTLIKVLPLGSVLTGLTRIGETFFFLLNQQSDGGHEVWKSDGTADGTVRLHGGFSFSNPPGFTEVNGQVFFSAFNAALGFELWKTDGTTAGTLLVKDIIPGTVGSHPSHLINFNGKLLFTAYSGADGISNRELWTSDGTAAGTVQFKDLNPGSGSSAPSELVILNDTLFFAAGEGEFGNINVELWKSDGTPEGTVRVKDIFPGIQSSNPRFLTNVNGTLFFQASGSGTLPRLWRSDGTEEGTWQVSDVPFNALQLTNANGVLYFEATTTENGAELWRSDGTSEGTLLVRDIHAGSDASFLRSLTVAGDTLFFRADDGLHGHELWFLPLEDPETGGDDPGVPMPSLAPVLLPPSDDPDIPDAWLSAPAEEPSAAVELNPRSRDAVFPLVASGMNNAAYVATPDRNRAKPAPLASEPRGIRDGSDTWVSASLVADLREKLALR